MPIRSINKYIVVKRFSLGKRMYDIQDVLYIQEHDPKNQEPQKVFNSDKEYVTDISADMFLSLNDRFVAQHMDNA